MVEQVNACQIDMATWDVMAWKTFPYYLLAICEGDPLATGRGPVAQIFDVSYGVPLSKFLNK